MSRFIDADRIDWRLIIPTNPTTAEENMIHLAKKLVERQPTADVVEVVKCESCKYSEHCAKAIRKHGIEKAINYCSYGERREDERK